MVKSMPQTKLEAVQISIPSGTVKETAGNVIAEAVTGMLKTVKNQTVKKKEDEEDIKCLP
jgi:hypothetical protein